MLTAEDQMNVLSWHFGEKISIRAIAKRLGVDRKTVSRVIRRRSVELRRSPQKRPSVLDPYKEKIRELMEKNSRIPATTIFYRIKELGYMGGVTVVKDHVRKVRPRSVEPFLRLQFAPGECAQVDWGEFGDVFGDGVKIHCFVMVLAYSRLIYVEFTRSEKFEDFVRAHETAFKYFGGVPKECWYDNLATAVTERSGSLVRFNARFFSYMGHHGTKPHACNVARGNEKGRVENGIKYIRSNFWPGRHFSNFSDLNAQAYHWFHETANNREHRSTRKVVRLQFVNEERDKLLELNPHPFDTDEILSKSVPQDFHLVYQTNRYSVPWKLAGIPVTIRVSACELRVFFHEQLVTTHKRSYLKHQMFTLNEHKEGLFEIKPGAQRESWQLEAVRAIGAPMQEYVQLLRSGRRSLRSELGRILALTTIYGEQAVNEASQGLLEKGVVGVGSLELALRQRHEPKHPEPLSFKDDKLNRVPPAVDLRRYDARLFEAKSNSASESEVTNENNTTDVPGTGNHRGLESPKT